MIDFEAQPDVKRAVARIETADTVGTGYLVAPDRVATCYHVVEHVAEGAPIALRFGELGELRTGFLCNRDQPSDAALIGLAQPMSAPPLDLSDRLSNAFWIHGYPHFAGAAVTLEGRLMDPDTLDPHGLRAFAMYSDQFAGRTPESIGGLSGGPVLDGRRVIGHMSSVLGSKATPKAPHLGYAFAVRSTGVARLLGGPAPGTPATPLGLAPLALAPAAAEDRAVALALIFAEVEAAASSSEILHALARALAAGHLVDPVRLFAAERLIGCNALSDALTVLKDAADAQRRSELEALALSLQGDHAPALALLRRIPKSAETAGLIGGTLKRRWLKTSMTTWLRAAHTEYSAAYAVHHDPYPGINAAACSLWLGDGATSRRIAAEVAAALAAKPDRSAWDDATLAEAHLLTGQLDAARAQYDAAVLRDAAQPRALGVMRRHARLDLQHLGQPAGALDDVFPVTRIAVFTGHRVDDDETRGRFPPSHVVAVKDAITRVLTERQIRIGYSSAASGGDLLFLEALLDLGGEAHVVLPFPAEAFVATSVGELWRSRFERVVQNIGGHVVVLSERVPDDPLLAFRTCNEALVTAAHDEGALIDETPLLIALVSPGSEATVGGAVEMVDLWATRARGEVIRIDPAAP